MPPGAPSALSASIEINYPAQDRGTHLLVQRTGACYMFSPQLGMVTLSAEDRVLGSTFTGKELLAALKMGKGDAKRGLEAHNFLGDLRPDGTLYHPMTLDTSVDQGFGLVPMGIPGDSRAHFSMPVRA